jgi:hypothetical protein
MNKINISKTDLHASTLPLGTDYFGTELMDHYLEAGGNVIDTAECYACWLPGGEHQSEKVIGEWSRERGTRDQIVLSTKGAHPKLESMDVPLLSKAEIQEDLDSSLRRLSVEQIDLYWLHRDSTGYPVAEILESLEVGLHRTWTFDQIFLNRPGNDAIQLDLLHDYNSNLALYDRWHEYFRTSQPRYRHGVESVSSPLEQALLLDLSASMMRIERDVGTRAVLQRAALLLGNQYSSWRRHHSYGRVCGHPAGESSHSSCRPNGVMSSRVKLLASTSTPRAVVK